MLFDILILPLLILLGLLAVIVCVGFYAVGLVVDKIGEDE
jgi:hypothetical protein